MTTGDDFWLMLHDMYCAVNGEGLPVEGKAEVLAGYFKLYPPVARKQILLEFQLVSRVISDIGPLVDGSKAIKHKQ